jgi:toxin ParE1/3/4
MRRVRLRGAARVDINLIMENIHASRPRSARRFFLAVEKLAKRLTELPELGGVYESTDVEFSDLRVFPIPRFKNYLLFYRVHEDGIDVVRVLHGARDIPTLVAGQS